MRPTLEPSLRKWCPHALKPPAAHRSVTDRSAVAAARAQRSLVEGDILRKSALPPTFWFHGSAPSMMWTGQMAGGREGDSRREPSDVTRLLRAFSKGESGALDELIPIVYGTLRRVARRQLRRERRDHTLSSTALVHEAYLELAGCEDLRFSDRTHFFAAAAQTMRHILIDYAVRRNAQKRGGDRDRVPVEEVALASEDHVEDLVSLDQALQRLEEVDERLVRIVECRFFAGLTIAETARALQISDATVSRDWMRARAWLNRELLRDLSPDDE